MPTYFITAIDTDAGKTVATGLLAKNFMEQGYSVITMKIAQTGCKAFSDDILEHRRIMGIDLTEDDKAGITCPYIFNLPASPHLAARKENTSINTKKIVENLRYLESKYDIVLVEGVGGLLVPLNDQDTVLDFILQNHLKVILITSAKLGSISHSHLTVDVCHHHHVDLYGIIYNHFHQEIHEIVMDSGTQIMNFARQYYPMIRWGEIPTFNDLSENHEMNLNQFLKIS